MPTTQKKQFSLSILVSIFVGVLVVVSIGVFLWSVMYVNERNRETQELRTALAELKETRDELTVMLGSAEAVNDLLAQYAESKDVLENSNVVDVDLLREYEDQLARIREMLNSNKYRRYIERIAREELALYYADEEIFFNDINK